ncbi:pyrroline-5-carboxylate reductase [Dehalobacterium formicoaceticum]|uniref:Pyrroline-5-carboxylate reductase n=1 Tax=Dehalobacterium formicoaceticum TaxID=51515 RepID=A0ABT1Y1W0_9FIRM|nr:pyrroline-5-carboxylate reductase [Dehalobacterium formicoaceticum]MCR6544538.1 pyrroline-5-carboxylate reductase [Dehalobacterium formicoaceticum]
MTVNIGFIGAGAMGEAFVSGLLKTEEYSPQTVHVHDIKEKRLLYLKEKYGIQTYEDPRELVAKCEVIVFSVKPQNIREVLSSLKDDFTEKHLIISIVAGFSIDSIYQYVSEKVSVIRAMPNTPCLIRKGVTCMAFSDNVSEAQKEIALNIMGSVGNVHILQERLLDAVTGLSGSGPAYIFLVIEALCDAGVRAGIPRDIALDLSVQTMIGSATMADITKTHPAILKDQVITPDGTTIAALHVLERAGVRVAFMDAVIAAAERSRELGTE